MMEILQPFPDQLELIHMLFQMKAVLPAGMPVFLQNTKDARRDLLTEGNSDLWL